MNKDDLKNSGGNRDVDDDSHPVATGVGVLGGGATGAAIGTAVAGPVGTVVGGVIGAVVGGMAGHAVGEAIDVDAEDAYWNENHSRQPYANEGGYDKYQPAYRAGVEGFNRHAGSKSKFDDVESDLRSSYEKTKDTVKSDLSWDKARPAAKAAWNRAESGEAVKVQISEEQVKVGKREVESGAVNIRKEVRTETVNTPVELKREEIVIERVNTGSGAAPADAFKGGEIRIPLKHEEAVVQKEAKVVGEVRVGKKQETEHQTISETVRKEEVKVDEQTTRRDDKR